MPANRSARSAYGLVPTSLVLLAILACGRSHREEAVGTVGIPEEAVAVEDTSRLAGDYLTEVEGETFRVPGDVAPWVDSAFANLESFLTLLPMGDSGATRLTLDGDDEAWLAILTPPPVLKNRRVGYSVQARSVIAWEDSRDRFVWVRPPDIKPMLAAPLVHDTFTIREVHRHARVKPKAWAAVFCEHGKLTVGYAADSLKARTNGLKDLNPYGFVFIRYHEYAHIALGHVWCNAKGEHRQLAENPKLELAADCKAVEILETFGEGGRSIVHNVHGQFSSRDGGADAGHPPFRARANNVYSEPCAP
jgi:hypothetical protein